MEKDRKLRWQAGVLFMRLVDGLKKVHIWPLTVVSQLTKKEGNSYHAKFKIQLASETNRNCRHQELTNPRERHRERLTDW